MTYNVLEIIFLAAADDLLGEDIKPPKLRVHELLVQNKTTNDIESVLTACVERLEERFDRNELTAIDMFSDLRKPNEQSKTRTICNGVLDEFEAATEKALTNFQRENKEGDEDISLYLQGKLGTVRLLLENLTPISDDDKILDLYNKAVSVDRLFAKPPF